MRTYALVAAKNHALNALRQRKEALHSIDELPLAGNENVFEQVVKSQDYALLYRAIEQLDQKYREVLLLYYVQQLKLPDVAVTLDRSYACVKKQLTRARQLLVVLCQKEGLCDAD